MTQVLADPVVAEIRAELGRHGRSQRWLAEQIGMNQPALSRRLAGKSSFSLLELRSIARALEISIAELVMPAASDRRSA